MLHDAFANGESEVEDAHGGVAFFKPGDNAQRVQIVVEGEAVRAEALIEGLLACMAKGRVANVVHKGERFGQLRIEAKGRGGSAGDLRDLKRVGEPTAEVIGLRIARQVREDLRLS